MKTQNSGEVQLWLQNALVNENLIEFSVDILGNSEKGDGYLGDIVFVRVKGRTANNHFKSYDLVLKCSKKSQALRDSVPIKETFENEIYVYSDVFPALKQFQIERGIENVFNSVSKYYGKFVSGDMEVLVLENLKTLGYKLYDRKIPLTFYHVKLLVREYGKWHAISAAMQDQQPEKFKQLLGGFKDVWRMFSVSMDVNTLFTTPLQEAYDLIKDDLTESGGQKLMELKHQVLYVIHELVNEKTRFSVIIHGDNWNNNFMFKYEEINDGKLLKVKMLDWQISRLASPVLDLSYFLYVCLSKEDLKKFDDILREYYESFSSYLRKLGSDPEKIFSYSDLLAEWKVFGKFGVVMALAVIKIALSEKDEVQDIAETAESGGDISSTFLYDIKNKDRFKDRAFGVVEHALEHGVI